MKAAPAISDEAQSAFRAKNQALDGKPFSLLRPRVEACSSLMGLDTSGASPLDWGVMGAGDVFKALLMTEGVDTVVVGVAPGAGGPGESTTFFWKKPKMDFWLPADCEPAAACLLCVGRGVDISLPSRPRAMLEIS